MALGTLRVCYVSWLHAVSGDRIEVNEMETSHVWERREVHKRFWWEKLIERNNVEDLDVVRWIILKCIRKKPEGKSGLDSLGARQGQVSGSCEHRKNLQVS
jgi:hypothetical protein